MSMNFNQLTAAAAAAAAGNPTNLSSFTAAAVSSLLANSNLDLSQLSQIGLNMGFNLGVPHATASLGQAHHTQQQNTNSRPNLHQSHHHRSSCSTNNSHLSNSIANLHNADNSLALSSLPVSLSNLTSSALVDLNPGAQQHNSPSHTSNPSSGGRSTNHRSLSGSNHHQQQYHHNNHSAHITGHQSTSSVNRTLPAAHNHPQTVINHRNSSGLTPVHNSHNSLNNYPNNRNNRDLNDLITCKICKGYLIDAATIDLCMHSFCRPCVVQYLRLHQHCPACYIEIKDKRYLNKLKSDTNLQNMVYILVPGLYEKEMERRRRFYSNHPSPNPRYLNEMFGDVPFAKTVKDDYMFNVGLNWITENAQDEKTQLCVSLRAYTTILSLKKLILIKFGLEGPVKIYYRKNEIYFDMTTIRDIAATYNWSPENNKFLDLEFKEVPNHHDRID